MAVDKDWWHPLVLGLLCTLIIAAGVYISLACDGELHWVGPGF